MGMTISGYFLTHKLPLLFVFSSVRQDKNIIIHRFMFHVRRIYCKFMLRLPRDTCMVRMSPLCQFISVFPRTIFYLFYFFPSFSFLSIFTSFFLFMAFRLLRALLSLLSFSSSTPFQNLVSLFKLPSLFFCSYGRSFLGLVRFPFYFFLFCSSV